METPRISHVIDMEFTERWESDSKLWVDTEDWDWDGLSEGWEIPAGEYGENEWEEVYVAGQECDHAPRSTEVIFCSASRHRILSRWRQI